MPPHEPRIDPRIAQTRQLVQRAVLAELAGAGYGGTTIEGVAARSGVAKSTIYRHWPNKLALIADALETLNVQPPVASAEGSTRTRVTRLLQHLAEAMSDPDLSPSVPALVEAAERDPTIARFHHQYADRRRQTLVDLLATGITAGELPPGLDPQLAALALAGAVVYTRLMTSTPFPVHRVEALVEQILGREPRS